MSVKKKSLRELKSSSFWRSCPLQLDKLPCQACPLGKFAAKEVVEAPKLKKKINIEQDPVKKQKLKEKLETIEKADKCPWWINSNKYNYCFWKYVNESSIEQGQMEPLLQNEIAEFFGCSATKIHFIIKDAMKNLVEGGHLEDLKDFLAEENKPDLEGDYSLGTIEKDD